MKHISDSERLIRAILNKKETQLEKAHRTILEQQEQLETMVEHITELKQLNKLLTSQISYLVSKIKSCPN